jgi:hypothetical protein
MPVDDDNRSKIREDEISDDPASLQIRQIILDSISSHVQANPLLRKHPIAISVPAFVHAQHYDHVLQAAYDLSLAIQYGGVGRQPYSGRRDVQCIMVPVSHPSPQFILRN